MKNGLIVLFVVFLTTQVHCQEKERILMVGNSFTFYYNLPMTLELMGKEKGLDWKVHQSTAGGATLKQHWEGEKALKTRKKIKRSKYTQIIFQEHSTYPLKAIDSTQKYLNKLFKASNQNAQKNLYATWSYPGILGESKVPESKSNAIEKALNSIKPTINTEILPVGRAFDLFQLKYPKTSLFTSDSKHPNPIGSYLVACVIFSSISKQSSKGLARRVASKSKKGKQVYYYIVEREMAKKCQQIADEILRYGNTSE